MASLPKPKVDTGVVPAPSAFTTVGTPTTIATQGTPGATQGATVPTIGSSVPQLIPLTPPPQGGPQVVPLAVAQPQLATERPMTPSEARWILDKDPLFTLIKAIAGESSVPRAENLFTGRARALVRLSESFNDELMVSIAPQQQEAQMVLPEQPRFGVHDVESRTWSGIASAVQQVQTRVGGPLSRISGWEDIVRGENQGALSLFAQLAGRMRSIPSTFAPTERLLDGTSKRLWYNIGEIIKALGGYDFKYGAIVPRYNDDDSVNTNTALLNIASGFRLRG